MSINLVVLQHDNSTGRYHPAYYTAAPMPGRGVDPVLRYRSRSHHTDGFVDLDDAKAHARELAENVSGEFREDTLVEMPEAGPDVLILPVAR